MRRRATARQLDKRRRPVRVFPAYSLVNDKAVAGPTIWLDAKRRSTELTMAEARELHRALGHMIRLVGGKYAGVSA